MAKLGLNMIVGPNEEYELTRCLESVKGLFDEIVIVVTDQSRSLFETAQKYATGVYYYKWRDDFSLARNFGLARTLSEYVMWLDADDIIKPDSYKKILELKPDLCYYDVYEFLYHYAHDSNDEPIDVLPRERIWKRKLNIKWIGRIHEGTDYKERTQRICRRLDIVIDHYRIKPVNFQRNLVILEEEYKNNPSPRTAFYYGRDLLALKKCEGLNILEEFLRKGEGTIEDLVAACKILAFYYKDINDFETSKLYCYKALTLSKDYAEFYVILGQIHSLEGNIDLAIQYNEEALKKKINAGFSQLYQYYKSIPEANLNALYKLKKSECKCLDQEVVDVIIISYNNPGYLDLCIRSIKSNLSYPLNLVISDMGSNEETWRYLNTVKGATIIGNPNVSISYSDACNRAIEKTFSKYFVILAQDTIVSKDWLLNLVKKMNTINRLAACGVLSNCEYGWHHNNIMKLSNITLVSGMTYEEIEPYLKELDEFMAQSNKQRADQFVGCGWLAVYATIFSRSAVYDVGLNSEEDLFVGFRKKGYLIGQAFDSFVFKFGKIPQEAINQEIKSRES